MTPRAPLSNFTTATATSSATLLVASLDGSGLLLIVLGLASELDANLALEDVLAGEVLDSLVGLIGGLQVDKGVANGAVGARVDGDGSTLAADMVSIGSVAIGIRINIHIIAGEEFLELILGGRIGEIPNVETTTFSGGSGDGFLLRLLSRRVLNGGALEGLGEVVDGSRHCG